MKTLNTRRLKELCNIHAVSGDTLTFIYEMQKLLKQKGIKSQVSPFGVLVFGNLKSPKVLISAHIDEVGFQIIDRNPDGTFKVMNSGHVDPTMLNNTDVYVNTSKGKIEGLFYPNKSLGDNRPDNFTQLFLDTIENNLIEIGDFGSYKRIYFENKEKIIATGLDNKISVEMILELIEETPDLLSSALFAFVTEEETTFDCIAGIAANYKPEYAFVLDMFPINHQEPEKAELMPEIGKGPGILYSMHGYKLNPIARKVIKNSNLKHQKIFVNIDFASEAQIPQRNGVTKGINIFVPMNGWHNKAYSMQISDFIQTKDFVKNLFRYISKN